MAYKDLTASNSAHPTIVRKSLLYRTRVEYGDYTMNHILGCSHGCKYPCYAFLLAKRFKKVKSYEDWIRPKKVENALEILNAELPRLAKHISSVHLCFTTDPFMFGYPEICDLSVQCIDLINSFGVPCTTLTKGILPIELKNLSKQNQYGITLISLDESYRMQVEPGAAPYMDRIDALKRLSVEGFNTWVSVEPYPTPNLVDQNIEDLLKEIRFVDKVIFGRCNYNKQVTAYKYHREFYSSAALSVMEYCKKNKIECHIKKGTL